MPLCKNCSTKEIRRMHPSLEHSEYLSALAQYANEVRAAGLEVMSYPLHLEDVFVELSAVQERTTSVSVTSQILSDEKHVILKGQPGQGKSIVLRQWAYRL